MDGFNYITLGATNCGWTFVDDGSLFGCTIISAGLGEDGTFDVEFASYGYDGCVGCYIDYNHVEPHGNKILVQQSDEIVPPLQIFQTN